MKRFFAVAALIMAVFVAVFGGRWLYDEYSYRTVSYRYEPASCEETTEELFNPYIGWYEIYGYTLGEDAFLGTELGYHLTAQDPDCQIVLVEINLAAYANGDITEHGLSETEMLISGWSATGKQLIVRFLYDFKGLAYDNEPKDIEIIKRHISQVSEILNAHSDSVYLVQGIFVGNVGEMNNSAYMTTEGMRELGNYYASVLSPSILMSVRTPEHYRIICERDTPLTEAEAYKGDIASRMGLFNDGMLASGNDLGTYGDGPISDLNSEHEGKGTRAEEIAFQNELCRYVVNGGEVVLDNEYNDLDNAITDLNDMHISYLGLYHDADVKRKWQSSVYESSLRGDDIYDGMSGYDYIGRHLGYRFVLRGSNASDMTFWNRDLTISFEVKNIGFSNIYREAELSLIFTDTDTKESFTIGTDADARFWDSDGGIYECKVDIPAGGLTGENYEVAVLLTDNMTGKNIAFSNGNNKSSYMDGAFVIGSLSYEKTEPW